MLGTLYLDTTHHAIPKSDMKVLCMDVGQSKSISQPYVSIVVLLNYSLALATILWRHGGGTKLREVRDAYLFHRPKLKNYRT